MTPARWRRIEDLFHSALPLQTAELDQFLDRECAGDDGLRGEVAALVRSHRGEGQEQTPRESFDDLAASLAADWLVERARERVGTVIGHYRITEWIGSGGMGQVYRAFDLRLRRNAALKILPPDSAREPGRLHQLMAEAEAASALNHPHIVTIYELEPLDCGGCIAMEFIEGETLSQRMTRGRLPLAQVVRLGVQAADALSEAHSRGVLHRDVKPANLMLTARGDVKLVDFGLARLQNGSCGSPADLRAGTLDYMSPEQLRGEEPDERADVYGLGVVLYEMLSGRRAFDSPTRAGTISRILEADPLPLRELCPGTPRVLDRVIGRCLAKNREQRYPSAAALRDALSDGLDRGWLPAWVSFVLIASLSLGAGWLLGRRNPARR